MLIEEQLETWVQAHVDNAVSVTDVEPMPGNSGLSFGFAACDRSGGVVCRLVIRLAPPNVRRQGNTDVLRQVPLLAALASAGVPTAKLIWSTADPRWFGTDAIVQELINASHLPMHRSPGATEPVPDPTPYLEQAADTLAQIHRVVWQEKLSEWDTLRTTESQIEFWGKLLAKQPEPAWGPLGEQLGQRLIDTDPGNHRIGLFHGDYQPHNILYDAAGTLVAVVDWEIAGIGPVGLDVGWLAIMSDPSCWHKERSNLMTAVADPAWILRQYERASGSELEHFDWYRALACFIYGSIAGFNLRLHRTGRRVDPAQELTGPAVPVLFRAGLTTLA